VTWWTALRHGAFFVNGLGPGPSAVAGPLLPALAAGLTAAIVLLLVDLASNAAAACLAVVVMLALPGFATLHSTSLTGPPLLALTVVMLALMMQSPRWSLGYGTVAAVAAVLVEPAGLGLILAAVGWAAVSARRDNRPPWRRMAFALLPIPIMVALAPLAGTPWAGAGGVAWRGGLDTGLQGAGAVLAAQLAPGISADAIRWFAIADLSLLLIAVLVAAARVARRMPRTTTVAVVHPASAVLATGIATGLALRWLFVPTSPALDVVAMMPLVVVGVIVCAASVGILWPRWPGWGKLLAAVIVLGWLQAAIRSP
jgi:hypothetical protein